MIKQFTDWLNIKSLSEKTKKDYKFYCEKFNQTFDELNQDTANEFLSSMYNTPGSRAFLNNYIEFIISNKTKLNIDKKIVARARRIRLPKITGRKKQRVLEVLTEKQVLNMMKYMEDKKYKYMLLLTYYGGLRLGELLKLRFIDFYWAKWKEDRTRAGEIRVFGKGNKEGIAYLPPNLMRKLRKWFNNSNKIRMSELEKPIFKVSRTRWHIVLKRAAKESGITTNVYPHLLRHSRATEMIKNPQVDVLFMKNFLRHSDISSTQIYAQIDKESIKDKVTELSLY